jgi:hypothetical protein
MTPKVALPRIPPWTAPTPQAVAKAAEAQRKREEGNKKQSPQNGHSSVSDGQSIDPKEASGYIGSRYAVYICCCHCLSTEGKSMANKELTCYGFNRVRVTNSLSNNFTGTIHSCNTKNDELVLSTGATDYHVIPLSKIKACVVLEREQSFGKVIDKEVSSKDKEKQAKVAEERQKKLVRPPGVSVVGHALFLILEKT